MCQLTDEALRELTQSEFADVQSRRGATPLQASAPPKAMPYSTWRVTINPSGLKSAAALPCTDRVALAFRRPVSK